MTKSESSLCFTYIYNKWHHSNFLVSCMILSQTLWSWSNPKSHLQIFVSDSFNLREIEMFSFDPWRRLVLDLNSNLEFSTILLLLKLLAHQIWYTCIHTYPPLPCTHFLLEGMLQPVSLLILNSMYWWVPLKLRWDLHYSIIHGVFLWQQALGECTLGKLQAPTCTDIVVPCHHLSLFISPPHIVSRWA